MNKKIIFIVLSLIISSCSSGNENTIDELEEQIEALENKQNLTPEEETELENLKTEVGEIPPPPEDQEFENEREATEFADLNDPIFSKYYTVKDGSYKTFKSRGEKTSFLSYMCLRSQKGKRRKFY